MTACTVYYATTIFHPSHAGRLSSSSPNPTNQHITAGEAWVETSCLKPLEALPMPATNSARLAHCAPVGFVSSVRYLDNSPRHQQ